MYCKTCGQKIRKDAVICPHCGCQTGYKKEGTSKKGIGFLLGFFLGIIGLIIGICMYESDSTERKTFIKGWLIAFIIGMVLSVISVIIYFAALGSIVGSSFAMLLV